MDSPPSHRPDLNFASAASAGALAPRDRFAGSLFTEGSIRGGGVSSALATQPTLDQPSVATYDPLKPLSDAVAKGAIPGVQRQLSLETLGAGGGARSSAVQPQHSLSLLQCGTTAGPSLGLPLDILGMLAVQIRVNSLTGAESGIVVVGDCLHRLASANTMSDEQRKGFCRMAAARFTLVEKLRTLGAPLEPVLAEDIAASPQFREVVKDLESVGHHRTIHPWAFYTAALNETANRLYPAAVQVAWSGFAELGEYALAARGIRATPSQSSSTRTFTGLRTGETQNFVPGCPLPAHRMIAQLSGGDRPTLYNTPGRIVIAGGNTEHAALHPSGAAPDVVSYIEHHGCVLARNGMPELGRLLLNGRGAVDAVTAAFPQLIPTTPTGQLVSQLERVQHYWGVTQNLISALPTLRSTAAESAAVLAIADRVLRDLRGEVASDRTTSTRGCRALSQQIRAAEFAQQNLRSQVVRDVLIAVCQQLSVETHMRDAASPTSPGRRRERQHRRFTSALTRFTGEAADFAGIELEGGKDNFDR